MLWTITPGELASLVGAAAIIIGGTAATGRAHINRRIDKEYDKQKELVDTKIDTRLGTVHEKLDEICDGQGETAKAVTELQVVINNGLATRVERIEEQVDKLVDHQLRWDGETERRSW